MANNELTRKLPLFFTKREHEVTLRIAAPKLVRRMEQTSRCKERIQTDIKDFFRQEVFVPGSRFAYRASQREYPEGVPKHIWRTATKQCLGASATLSVETVTTYNEVCVELKFTIYTRELAEPKDLGSLFMAVEGAIELEQQRLEIFKQSLKEPLTLEEVDHYEKWRSEVYSEITAGLMAANMFEDENNFIKVEARY